MNQKGRHYFHITVATFVFTFVAMLSFLLTKDTPMTNAVDLSSFNAGNIISDYVMENYNTMSRDDINNFLHRNMSCDDYDLKKTNIGGYRWEYVDTRDSSGINYNYRIYFAPSGSYSNYHVENGHFVCLADETFNGQSAADVIYDVAHKYHINPQVLIVLLQKEQGLISDKFPNAVQYRSATGYGCPDTAACDSEYYGFKNQLENAASLFRYVLDNGSYYKPVGNNYIQYNPNSGCGGSMVYIENRATAALYQYTPYQPNGPALNAGYGIGDGCSAYGNRNFYLYFSDWFGGPNGSGYEDMVSPRYLTNLKTGEIKYYTIKRDSPFGICLSDNPKNNCTLISDLETTQWSWDPMYTSRYLTGNNNSKIVNLTADNSNLDINGKTIYYNKKTILPDGRQCLLPRDSSYSGWCAIFETLDEAAFKEQLMSFPRNLSNLKTTSIKSKDPITEKTTSEIAPGTTLFFFSKIILPNGENCLLAKGQAGCILQGDLSESWTPMDYMREMIVTADTYKVDPFTSAKNLDIFINRGMQRKFISKAYYNGGWCLRTEYDEERNIPNCIPMNQLREAWTNLDKREQKTIKINAKKINAIDLSEGLTMWVSEKRFFTQKYYIPSKAQWCYKTEYDTQQNTNYCFLESDLQ